MLKIKIKMEQNNAAFIDVDEVERIDTKSKCLGAGIEIIIAKLVHTLSLAPHSMYPSLQTLSQFPN